MVTPLRSIFFVSLALAPSLARALPALECSDAPESKTPSSYSATVTSVRHSVFYEYARTNLGAPLSCRWVEADKRIEITFPRGVTVSEGPRPAGKLETHGKFGDAIEGLKVEEARAIDLLEKSSVDWFGSAAEDKDWTDQQHLYEHDGCIAVAAFVPGKDGRVVSASFLGDDTFQCWPPRFRTGAQAARQEEDCRKTDSALFQYATEHFGKPVGCEASGKGSGVHTVWRFAGGVSLRDEAEALAGIGRAMTTLSGIRIEKEDAVPIARTICADCHWDRPERLSDRTKPGEERVSFRSDGSAEAHMLVRDGKVVEISAATTPEP